MTESAKGLAVAAVASVLTEASPSEGVMAQYFRAVLPPAPPGPGVSEREMHEWLEALPESITAMLLPLVGLAAQAVADLAAERDETLEKVLSDVAARVLVDEG